MALCPFLPNMKLDFSISAKFGEIIRREIEPKWELLRCRRVMYHNIGQCKMQLNRSLPAQHFGGEKKVGAHGGVHTSYK